MRKLGSLEPVVFFINYRDPRRPEGYCVLAPYSDFPTPDGHSRETAETLAEVDRLQKRLVEQEERKAEADFLHNEVLVAAQRQRITDSLRQRMVSSSTSAFEREFIESYLKLREEKRAKYRDLWLQRTAYLHAREMDTPRGRPVDSERVNVDRIG